MFNKNTSIQITIYWIVGVIMVGTILGLIANSTAAGGEQKLFTYFANSIVVALVGVVLINFISIVSNSAGGSKIRLFNLCFIMVSLVTLYPLFKGVFGTQYDLVEKTRFIGPDKIHIKIEYYNSIDTSRIIRSESFWRNGKKDSVWTTYEKDGNILKRLRYKNDELVERVK